MHKRKWKVSDRAEDREMREEDSSECILGRNDCIKSSDNCFIDLIIKWQVGDTKSFIH